jgi:lysophospholipase L1-like esterase
MRHIPLRLALGTVVLTAVAGLVGPAAAETAPGRVIAGPWAGARRVGTREEPLRLGKSALGPVTAAVPGDRAIMTGPVSGSEFPLALPTPITFSWTAVSAAASYLFEFTPPNRAFTNPNGTGPDPVNGFTGSGGGLIVTGTSFGVLLDPDFPPGEYEVRVLPRLPGGAYFGSASDPVRLSLGLELIVPPTAQSALTAPVSGFRVSRGDPTPFTFTWTAIDEVVEYGLEYTGSNRAFANPNGTAPDPVNGSGGAGGMVVVSGTSLPVVLEPSFPLGTYQVRVIGLSGAGNPVGRFSNAITVVNGLWLPADLSPILVNVGLAYGDSITEGTLGDSGNPEAGRPYPEGVEQRLQPFFPGFFMDNRGRGGETTAQGLSRLSEDADATVGVAPAVVLLMEGTNDATFNRTPASIVNNLRSMIHVVKAAGAIPILGAIIPNFRDTENGIRAQGILEDVNADLPGVAEEEGIRYVDTFSAMNNHGLYGGDDLHPTQEGYDRLAETFLPVVIDALNDLRAALNAATVVDAASEAPAHLSYPTGP